MARVTKLRRHESLEPIARELAFTLGVESLQIGNHALERTRDFARLAGAPEIKINLDLARSVHELLFEIVRQILVKHFEADAVMRRHSAHHRFVINNHPLAAAPPRQHRALLQRFLRVRHHQTFIENHFLPKPVAHRTRSTRRVKRKMFRCERLVTLAGGGTEVAIGMNRLNPDCRLPIADWSDDSATLDFGLWTLDSSGN